MNRRMCFVVMVLCLLSGTLNVRNAGAAAYGAPWQTSITIQNLGTASTTFTIRLYPELSGTPVVYNSPTTLAPLASTSVPVGTIPGINAFKGSATVTSGQPLGVTMVQYAAGQRNRPLANGIATTANPLVQVLPMVVEALTAQQVAELSAGTDKLQPLAPGADPFDAQALDELQATGSTVVIPTVLKNTFGTNTVLAVQNASASTADMTLRFYAAGSTTPLYTGVAGNIPGWATALFDTGQVTVLGASFNGSMVATGVVDGTATPSPIAAVANEFGTNSDISSAFEGAQAGSTVIYMPSALCQFSPTQQNTAYAVQNVSLSASATFQVEYQNGITSIAYTVGPNSKVSVLGCSALAAGTNTSAIIRRTAGTGTLIAVGKVSGGGLSTAFLGFTSGSARVAMPYVRWSPNSTYNTYGRQRAYIAVQNVGTTTATNVRIQYIDRNGTVLGTDDLVTSIPPGGKISSNPAFVPTALDSCGRFGEYGGGADCVGTAFGGGAVVLAAAGNQLAVLVRVTSLGTGEDYGGINY